MLQEEDYNRLSIENSIAVQELLDSRGWKLIEPLITEKKESISLKKQYSDDPSIVMACVRQEDGLMFIYEVIQDFLSFGDEAMRSSAK